MFKDQDIVNSALQKSCGIAVAQVFKAQKEERALIIANPDPELFPIAQALYNAFLEAQAQPVLMVQQAKTSLDFCDAAIVQAILSGPSIIVSLSAEKLGKDAQGILKPYTVAGREIDNAFEYLMALGKTRAFWSPGITRAIFEECVAIDYQELKSNCLKIKKVLDEALSVRIVSAAGTDFFVGLEGRQADMDDGDFSAPGSGGNLPAGETYISPANYSCHGVLVLDGSLSLENGTLLVKEPVRVLVEGGFVTEISGGAEAAALKKTLEAGEKLAYAWEKAGKLPKGQGENYAKHAKHIGELGIGLNRAANLIGNMLADEKALRTCHIAIGANYADDANALIHQDCVLRQPDIIAVMPDGSQKTILQQGNLKL